MKRLICDIMTRDVAVLRVSDTVEDAACAMRDRKIGDVLITREEQLLGIVTDRDLVVRALAEHLPANTPLSEICTPSPVAVAPEALIEDAIVLMRDHAIRRLPVLENGQPVGIVSLGDLAQERSPESLLSDISRAPSNL